MSWDRDSSEMRYKRLQHLLEKSNIYSKFLLTKMEQQQLEVSVFYQSLEARLGLYVSVECVNHMCNKVVFGQGCFIQSFIVTENLDET